MRQLTTRPSRSLVAAQTARKYAPVAAMKPRIVSVRSSVDEARCGHRTMARRSADDSGSTTTSLTNAEVSR
jgi:hypothetical protein